MKMGERMHNVPATVRKIPAKMSAGPVSIRFPITANVTAPPEAHPRAIPALTHPLAGIREKAAYRMAPRTAAVRPVMKTEKMRLNATNEAEIITDWSA